MVGPHRAPRPVAFHALRLPPPRAQLPDDFKSLPLKKVTPKVVDDLYRFLGKPKTRKPATVLRFHALLRAVFTQALRWGWVDRNPIERAPPPHVNRQEIEPPAIEDVLRVLERAGASRNRECAGVSPPRRHRLSAG